MTEAHIGDAARFIALTCGGALLGLSVLTTVLYARVYYRDRRIARAQGVPLAWRGLLPSHVALIGVSYTLLTAHGLLFVFQRLGRPSYVWGGVLAVAMLTGVAGQWSLLRHERRQYPRHPDDVAPLRTPPTGSRESSGRQ